MDLSRRLSASRLRLRRKQPFFAALSLFARLLPDPALPTAATDGRDIFYNPEWLAGLTPPQLDGVLLHELLHAALLHPSRRKERDPVRWNIAADIVVNGMVAEVPGVELLTGAIREKRWEKRSVEEIYQLLEGHEGHTCPSCLRPVAGGPEGALDRMREIEAHWKNALAQAQALTARLGQGNLPAGARRLLDEVMHPRIDWRSALWRFLVRTPTDFAGFDRRLVHRGLYLEALTGESLRVLVCVDTSGSVSPQQLAAFMGEVRGILATHAHTRGELWYADAGLHGPFPIAREARTPQPRGGGGTSFVPFFDAVEKRLDPFDQAVCVYFTDGWGAFPQRAPDTPVLWVVTPGGAADAAFPFGDVVRMV